MSEDNKVEGNDVKNQGDTTPPESEKSQQHTIPYDRFRQVNEEKRELEEKLKLIAEQQEAERQKKLQEDGKLEELLEVERTAKAELAKKAAQAEEAMAVISSSNEQMINELPESIRQIAEDLKEKFTPTELHSWLTKNKAAIAEIAQKPSLGKNVSAGDPSNEGQITLKEAQRMLREGTQEEYEKANKLIKSGNVIGL